MWPNVGCMIQELGFWLGDIKGGFPKLRGASLGFLLFGNPTIWGGIIVVPDFRQLPCGVR